MLPQDSAPAPATVTAAIDSVHTSAVGRATAQQQQNARCVVRRPPRWRPEELLPVPAPAPRATTSAPRRPGRRATDPAAAVVVVVESALTNGQRPRASHARPEPAGLPLAQLALDLHTR